MEGLDVSAVEISGDGLFEGAHRWSGAVVRTVSLRWEEKGKGTAVEL